MARCFKLCLGGLLLLATVSQLRAEEEGSDVAAVKQDANLEIQHAQASGDSISVSNLLDEIVQRVKREGKKDTDNPKKGKAKKKVKKDKKKKSKDGKKKKLKRGGKKKKKTKGGKKKRKAKRGKKKRKTKGGKKKRKTKGGKKKRKTKSGKGKKKTKRGGKKKRKQQRGGGRRNNRLKKKAKASVKQASSNITVQSVAQLARIYSTACITLKNLVRRIPALQRIVNNKEGKKGEFQGTADLVTQAIGSLAAPRCADSNLTTEAIKGTITTLNECLKKVEGTCSVTEPITGSAARITECKAIQVSFCKKVDDTLLSLTTLQTPAETPAALLASADTDDLTKVRACIDELNPVDESIRSIRTNCVSNFTVCKTEQVGAINPIGKCPVPGGVTTDAGGSTSAGGGGGAGGSTTAAGGGSGAGGSTTAAGGGGGAGGGSTTAAGGGAGGSTTAAGGGGSGTTASSSSSGALSTSSSIAILSYQSRLLGDVAGLVLKELNSLTSGSGRQARLTRADGAQCVALFAKVQTATNKVKDNAAGKGKNQTMCDETTKALLEAKEEVTNNGATALKTCEGASSGRQLRQERQSILAQLRSLVVNTVKEILASIASSVAALVTEAALPAVASNDVTAPASITASSSRQKKRMAVENVLQQFRFQDEFGN